MDTIDSIHVDKAPVDPVPRRVSFQRQKSLSERTRTKLSVNPKLISLKICMLLFLGGMTSLLPFMTIHMKAIGLTLTEIAVIYAVLPFVCFVGPPIGGAIADKVGNYKIVFVIYAFLNVISHLLIWFAVPSALPTVVTSKVDLPLLNLHVPCGSSYLNSSVSMSGITLNDSCKFEHSTVNGFNLRFRQCTSDCDQQNQPTLCLIGPSGERPTDCSPITDFEKRYLSNGAMQVKNKTFLMLNFTAEEGQPVSHLACILPSTTGKCSVSCSVESNQQTVCQTKVPAENRSTMVALYVVFRFFAGITLNTFGPMLDAIAFTMAKQHKGDLGFQRMFSLIGMAAFPPLSGYFVGLASRNNGFPDFSPAFYLFGSCFTLGGLIALTFDLKAKMPKEEITKNAAKILRRPRVFVFVIMMFLTGCMWGFLENYLFIFMEELGSPKFLLGLTSTVSSLSAIPVVASSIFLIKHVGNANLIILACILFGCRFLSYSFIYNPYHILPVEVLESFTTSLLWVVSSVYCGKIAPDYLATVQGIVGAAHAAVGRGIGSLVGGVMFEHFKPRKSYQMWAGFCFGVAFVYAIVQYGFLRKSSSRAKIRPSENKEEEPDLDMEFPLSEEDERGLEEAAEVDGMLVKSSGGNAYIPFDPLDHTISNNTSDDLKATNGHAVYRPKRDTTDPVV